MTVTNRVLIHMDDRVRMDENGTLYLDETEKEETAQVLEIESNGLLYYLFMAAIAGIFGIIVILALLFFGLLLILLVPLLLFFGLLLLLAFFRRRFASN
jgi:hypothetical protein